MRGVATLQLLDATWGIAAGAAAGGAACAPLSKKIFRALPLASVKKTNNSFLENLNCSSSTKGTGDGSRDAGEPGLAGFVIYADYNNSGTLDGNEPWTSTAATDGGWMQRAYVTSASGGRSAARLRARPARREPGRASCPRFRARDAACTARHARPARPR